MANISSVIRQVRDAQRISQRELAKRAGVTPVYVCQLETGARRNPSLIVLRRLAKALGLPVSALTG